MIASALPLKKSAGSRRGFHAGALVTLVVASCLVALLGFQTAFAASSVNKVIKSGCYYYKSASSATSARAGYLSFGQDVSVVGSKGDYAVINIGGKQYYVRSNNVAYKTMTVVKNRVQVKKAASGKAAVLEYAYYNDKVSVIDDSGSYVHCLTATGKDGYINKAYLSPTATPKVVNAATKLYSKASGSSSSTAITAGEEVQMSMSNGTWAKVTYKGRPYFMYADKLDAKVLHLSVNRAYQMKDAKVGAERVQYVYWDKACTVLNSYESETYGTYYYCKVGSKYGFVRGMYFGSTETKQVGQSTSLYALASDASGKVASLNAGQAVNVLYSNGTWSKVECGGNVGYVLDKYLKYPRTSVSGYAFETTYQAYAYEKYGTVASGAKKLSGTFDLHGQSSKYGCIDSGSGLRYVLQRDMKQEESADKTMYALVPILTLYAEPNSSSATVEVPYMTAVQVVKNVSETKDGTWTQVRYQNADRYVWTAAGSSPKLTDEKSSFTYKGSNDIENEIIAQSLDVLNSWETSYVHGSTGEVVPGTNKHGFDCSGFASYVLNNVMDDRVPVYRVSAGLQNLYKTDVLYNKGIDGEARAKTVWSKGQKLDVSALHAGDLLFFNLEAESGEDGATSEYNHVGVYLGNGEFIHCTHTWDRVIIMPLSDFYVDGLVSIRRAVPDQVSPANKAMKTVSTQTKVRSSMDSSNESNVVATLDSDKKVTLLYVSDTETWGYVDTGSKKGFVLMKYLAAETSTTSQQGYVATTSVRLYESASSKSDSVEAYCTEPLELHGMKSGTSYYRVTYRGETRYIYLGGKTLESVVTTDLDALLKGSGTKTVQANTYVRTTPASDSDDNKVELIRKGEKATVIAVSSTGTWTYIRYGDDAYGYVLSSKLA